jgi:glycosyltransferase involved in cell wall biosynthesis
MAVEKIRVLFVLPSLIYTGAEKQVVDLLNNLSEEDFESHLLVLGEELDLLDRLNRDKVKFFHCPRKHKYDFSPRREIARIIDRQNIDILHCTNQIPIFYGFLGKLQAKKKVKFLGALHTTINRSLKNELFDWFLYAPVMRSCDLIITVCDNQKNHWSRKYPWLRKKFIAIHNGIDMDFYKDSFSAEEKSALRRSLGIGEESFVAAVMAEFRVEKGHEYALQALRWMLDRGYSAKFLFIGSGEREEQLRFLSESLSIEKHIVWAGYQKDPRPYLSLCDVLCVPSFTETFSLTVLEALAMGKPVVATNVGGTPEMVFEGVNGFLANPKDSVSLAKKLEKLIADESRRLQIAAKARESVVERFSLVRMVNKTESLLKRTASQ